MVVVAPLPARDEEPGEAPTSVSPLARPTRPALHLLSPPQPEPEPLRWVGIHVLNPGIGNHRFRP